MFRLLSIAVAIIIVSVVSVVAHDDGNYSYNSKSKKVCRNVKWTGGDSIDWPCATTKQLYRSNKKFVSKNMLATRVAVHGDMAFLAFPSSRKCNSIPTGVVGTNVEKRPDKDTAVLTSTLQSGNTLVFHTIKLERSMFIDRLKTGVPFTLGKASLRSKGCEASIVPFPCWSVQEEGDCAALQSVVDVFLDPHDILWALDTGIVNSLDNPVRTCSPKVVAINVKTGKIVKTIDLSPLTTNKSRLQYVVADYASNGHVFIYVSDAESRAILVFDVTSGRGYRVILPKAVTCGAARRDVLNLALIRRPDGTSCLLFTYFSGTKLFSIKTTYLQSGQANGKVNDLGPKKGKVVFLGTDNGSAIFFRKQGESDIYRWDLLDCPTKDNIQKVFKGKKCELPTHVVPDYNRDRMRVLESNFPDYFEGKVGCGANHALTIF